MYVSYRWVDDETVLKSTIYKKFKDLRVLPSCQFVTEANNKQQIHIESFNYMLYLNRLMNFKGINNL